MTVLLAAVPAGTGPGPFYVCRSPQRHLRGHIIPVQMQGKGGKSEVGFEQGRGRAAIGVADGKVRPGGGKICGTSTVAVLP